MKPGKENKKLKIYGLKQAPRAWNTRIDTYFKKIMHYEHALYVKKEEGNLLLVLFMSLFSWEAMK